MSNQRPDPTPEEIRAGTERIQSTWSDREKERRCKYKSPPVTMPTLSWSEFILACYDHSGRLKHRVYQLEEETD